MTALATGITGRVLSRHQFRVHQTSRVVDVDAVMRVLRGTLAAYQITNFIDLPDCRRIVENFWAMQRTPRYGDGSDGVEAYIVGTSHIEKTIDEYLADVEESAHALEDLYRGVVNPVASFREQLTGRGGLARARAAAHDGRIAGDSKAVFWNKAGEYALMPHDDLAQLGDPRQMGFEIQRVRRVMAVNAYPQVPAGTGQIKIWNVEPDDRSRYNLGLLHSGFPYPPETLDAGHPSLVVPVRTGDLCVINGNLAHAVLGGQAVAPGDRRLLITCFTGLTDGDDMLWWT